MYAIKYIYIQKNKNRIMDEVRVDFMNVIGVINLEQTVYSLQISDVFYKKMGTTGEISTDNMKIKLENLKQDYKKFQK